MLQFPCLVVPKKIVVSPKNDTNMNTELLKLDLISKILLIEEMGLLMELEEWIEQGVKTLALSNPYVMKQKSRKLLQVFYFVLCKYYILKTHLFGLFIAVSKLKIPY
jgi:hypothetical protein